MRRSALEALPELLGERVDRRGEVALDDAATSSRDFSPRRLSRRRTPSQRTADWSERSNARESHGRETRRNRWTPLLGMLARDLREHRLALGRPGPNTLVVPAHDGGHWQPDDWRNWRRRVWRSWLGGDPKCKHAGKGRCESCGARRLTPAGTRPREVRGSYVTVQVYAGVPLTTIARWCGTSVAMLDKHYAGVIANWDGEQVSANEQIQRARSAQREGRAS
jgi:hypothetical protein